MTAKRKRPLMTDGMPPIPEGLEPFAISVAEISDSEIAALDAHIKEKFFDKEDVQTHLYNTDLMIQKLLYLVVWALHGTHHEHEDFTELKSVKKKVSKTDSLLRKHKPMLELLDKEVQNRVALAKRHDIHE